MSDRNDNGRWVLPEGWVWTRINSVCEDIYRYPTFYGMEHLSEGIPVIRGEHIHQDGTISHDWNNYWYVANEVSREFPRTILAQGDLVMSVRGSIGKVGLVDAQLKHAQLSPNCIKLSPKREICDSRFLFHYLRTGQAQELIQGQSNATTIQTIKASSFKNTPIPLPPLSIQHRIVSEIEKQFTRLDAAVAALRRAKANLARYKAAVLQAAVTGRLVADRPQRSADGSPLETSEVSEVSESASDLLARILAERRARWEAANPKKPYVEPKGPDVAGLPGLPEGWVWARFEQLLLSSQNGFGKRTSSTGEPTIVLRLADIAQGAVSVANVRRIRLSNEEVEKYKLHKGDLLCLRVNGSPNLVGRMVNIRGFVEDVAFCDHFIRFQLVDLETSPYVSIYFESETIRKFIELNMVSSAGQNTVSQRTLAEVQVPLPPIAEQQRIVLEIERQISVIQASEQVIDANLARANRLRQGVLGKAFRGELV